MLLEYRTLAGPGRAEIVVNRSRFISSAAPADTEEEAQVLVARVRKEYHDAAHHVYAYVVGDNDEIQRWSDDGEPAGTAGRPVLEVLRREGLKYAAIVVTRYFGGVKLGAAGLARAYGRAATAGLRAARPVTRALHVEMGLAVEYTLLGKLEGFLASAGTPPVSKEYGEVALLRVMVPVAVADRFGGELVELTGGKIGISRGKTSYLVVTAGS